MKSTHSKAPAGTPESSKPRVGRRSLVAGAGVAGVAAVAAYALHRGAVEAPLAAAGKAASAEGEGYRLTPHVLRYYETTKA